jgi:hypothetical protein
MILSSAEVGTIDEKSFVEAQKFLERVRSLLATNEFQVSQRDKNQEFLEKYRIKERKIKEMLLALNGTDCNAIEPNNNPRYREALVYKFMKVYELDYFGDTCDVTVYIKQYIIEKKTYDLVMVISFHEDDKD